MNQKFTPARTEEIDGYVFASPEMRGRLNKHGKPWTKRTIFLYNVQQVLYRNNKWHAKRKKPVSEATKSHRFNECRAMANDLHDLDFKIMLPTKIRQKHVKALTRYWEGRDDLQPASVIQKVSILRTFLGWVGKSGVINNLTPSDLFAEPEKFKRSLVADRDKSWTPAGDPKDIIRQIIEVEPAVGSQLMLSHLFGLRPKETWCFKPRRDYDDENQLLYVREGSKGGRPRIVPVLTEEQRAFLKDVCNMAYSVNDSLIPKRYSLAAWKSHYYRVMRDNGISKKNGLVPHGLRHGYAHNIYEQYAGHPAAVKEPEKRDDFDKVQARIANLLVSEQLGHSRESITSAYTGKHN